MDKEKEELVMRTAKSFVKKSEIEKAFILGYMFKKMQFKSIFNDCMDIDDVDEDIRQEFRQISLFDTGAR